MKDNKTDVNSFNTFRRVVMFMIFAIVAIVVLFVVNSDQVSQSGEKIDFISGMRVGCAEGWESDYLLSGREDITLLRYEDNASALVALSSGQLDVVTMDEDMFSSIKPITEGLEVYGDPIAKIEFTLLFSPDRKDLNDEFNSFLREFKKTDQYKDLVERAHFQKNDVFVKKEIEPVESDKVIKACFVAEYYPQCYLNTETDEPDGVFVEIINIFAAAKGYKVEWTEASEESAVIGISSGAYDVNAASTTNIFREDYERVCFMSDPMYCADVLAIRIKPGEKLVLKGIIEQ